MKDYIAKVEVQLSIQAENKKVADKAAKSWDGSDSVSCLGHQSYILNWDSKPKLVELVPADKKDLLERAFRSDLYAAFSDELLSLRIKFKNYAYSNDQIVKELEDMEARIWTNITKVLGINE